MQKDNLIAFVIFIISTIAFVIWGFGYISQHQLILFILASIFGIFMAFNIGGNDVANSFGTSVGAKTVTIKQALIIAAVFELSGAIFAGAEVTKTIRSGIVIFPNSLDPMLFVIIMLAALLSSGVWIFIATKKGLPVSTTHSIVGGIVGASIMMGLLKFDGIQTLSMVKWSEILRIAISWVASPLLGGIVAVSYTDLTLPPSKTVVISVVAGAYKNRCTPVNLFRRTLQHRNSEREPRVAVLY
ncbi:inorganic phosphate transporter, partial [Campylobacter jejuni]